MGTRLFSTPYVPSGCGFRIETCGPLLNLDALSSYEFDYTPLRRIFPAKPDLSHRQRHSCLPPEKKGQPTLMHAVFDTSNIRARESLPSFRRVGPASISPSTAASAFLLFL